MKESTKMFTKLAMAIILSMIFSLGCSLTTKTQKEKAKEYEEPASILLQLYHDGMDKCESGEFTTEECIEIGSLYDHARDTYILTGDYLIQAIESTTYRERNEAMNKYKRTMDQSLKLILELNNKVNGESEEEGGEQ